MGRHSIRLTSIAKHLKVPNFAIEAQIEKPPSTIAADLKRGNGHHTFIGGR